MSKISLAVELMTPFSLVVEDGEGDGAGEGVFAAEEPRRDDAGSSKRDR